jgi:phage portal protein BeeE
VGLLDRIAARGRPAGEVEHRYSADQYLAEYVLPNIFNFGGSTYPYGLNTTWSSNKAQEISSTLPGHSAALKGCPPAFAAQMVRALVLSQARFTFRSLASSGTPRRTFGTRNLSPLEKPWPSATTGELIARMEWHAGLAGNAFVYRRGDRLRVLRPDWVTVVYGSQQEPDDALYALDGELIGFVYQNGGRYGGNKPVTLLPDEVAHWCPLPDPEASHIGMSWITPAVREIQGDRLATDHKVKFFENGATPNLVVSGIPAATKEQFDELVEAMEGRHAGVANAYRTLYLTAGADATVVGSDLRQLDFKQTQGTSETRIAFLSRVPAPLLGISEGLAGSSLNAGNFGQARRSFADTWVFPTLQDLAASLSDIIDIPADAELWFDTADMPILREDARDAADIAQTKMATIVSGVNGGFKPDDIVAAVAPEWVGKIKHSGLLSVQLQPPGTVAAPAQAKALPAAPQRSEDGDDEDRVGGVDTHPGGEQLKHYWLHGEGAAKWSTWTELYHHLVKYLTPTWPSGPPPSGSTSGTGSGPVRT